MKKKKKQGKKRKWLIPLAVVLLAAVVFSVLVGTKVIRINTLLAAEIFLSNLHQDPF